MELELRGILSVGCVWAIRFRLSSGAVEVPGHWQALGITSLLALFVRVITVVNAMYSAQHLAHQFSGGCTVSIVCNAWVASP